MCLVSNSGCSEQHNRRHRDPGKKPGLQPVRHERSTRQEWEARNRCCNRAGQTRLNESIDKVAKPARNTQHADLSKKAVRDDKQELGFVDYRKQDFKVAIIRIVSKSAPARLASPF